MAKKPEVKSSEKQVKAASPKAASPKAASPKGKATAPVPTAVAKPVPADKLAAAKAEPTKAVAKRSAKPTAAAASEAVASDPAKAPSVPAVSKTAAPKGAIKGAKSIEIEVDENGEAILPEAELAADDVAGPKPERPKESLPIPTNLPPRRADGVITLAHSPDADDAFMFYALAAGKVDTEDRKYEHVLKDIQSLNVAAKKGVYDVTALSFHAYPYVRRNYALLTCGASFGDAYGPVLVAKTPIRPSEVDGMTVAMPGELTTAALITRMWFGRAKIDEKQVPFDKVTDLVRAGLVRAGVIIHEGQLTYKELGLVRVVDFGQWWSDRTEGLPLPLGGNGVRRDIPKPMMAKIALDLKRSIAYALGHREEALAHAMKYGRSLSKEKADKFVGMYVNDLTLDYGERGRQAVKYLLDRAVDEGFLKEKIEPEFVG